MTDINGTGSEPPKKKKFISEKIVKQPMSRAQMAKRCAVLLFMAAVFGVIAAITFTISRPLAEKYIGGSSTEESETISIPKDEETQPTEPLEETEEETTPISELVREAMENYHFDMNTVNNIYNNLRLAGQKANNSIVTVHSVTRDTDWFDNPIENAGQYAGAVIAVTDSEILILAPDTAVESADAIFVTFYNDIDVEGTKKQADKIRGLAVISVAKSAVPQEKAETIVPFTLGNSYTVRAGDLILSVGAPAGMPYSFDYGAVNYIARNSQAVDGAAQIMFLGLKGNADAGTFILNTAGEIIGWVTDKYDNDENADAVIAEGISSYKGILEKMSNGIATAYLGIKCQELTQEMISSGMPQGLYVAEAVSGGPAYNAGIQNGDIITSVNGEAVSTIEDFQTRIEEMDAGATVEIVVKRNGRETYTELVYQVVTGER